MLKDDGKNRTITIKTINIAICDISIFTEFMFNPKLLNKFLNGIKESNTIFKLFKSAVLKNINDILINPRKIILEIKGFKFIFILFNLDK